MFPSISAGVIVGALLANMVPHQHDPNPLPDWLLLLLAHLPLVAPDVWTDRRCQQLVEGKQCLRAHRTWPSWMWRNAVMHCQPLELLLQPSLLSWGSPLWRPEQCPSHQSIVAARYLPARLVSILQHPVFRLVNNTFPGYLRANHSSSVPVISCMVWTETGCQRTCAAEGELKIKSNMNLFLASIILYQAFMAHALISGSCWGDRQSKLRKRRRARLGRASRMTFPGGIREIFNKVSAVNWFCQQVHGFSQSEASFKSPVWKATRLISILYTTLRLQYPVFPLCQLSFSRLRANLGSKHWRTLVCCPLTFSSFGLAVERSLAW